MDPTAAQALSPNALPPMPASTTPRKSRISRENESPSQRNKREKAAERQRRKRERDRHANALAASAIPPGVQQHVLQQQQEQQTVSAPPAPSPSTSAPSTQMLSPLQTQQHHISQPPPSAPPIGSASVQSVQVQTTSVQTSNGDEYMMSSEEVARRDRVRAAARERQRKHRALVKQRKLRELGLDMGNEIIQGMDEVQFRVAADASAAFAAHAQAQAHAHAHAAAAAAAAIVAAGHHHPGLPPHPPPPPPHELGHPPPGGSEPPFPGGPPGQLGGQTFASTLLLSFSCAPLLKAHLLRTLQMTNDELASLEPIIAQAWDQWDHNVRSFLSCLPYFCRLVFLRFPWS